MAQAKHGDTVAVHYTGKLRVVATVQVEAADSEEEDREDIELFPFISV
jgi:hypothetical protein